MVEVAASGHVCLNQRHFQGVHVQFVWYFEPLLHFKLGLRNQFKISVYF